MAVAIDHHVSWVYTKDVEAAFRFYEEKIGPEPLLDEAIARIYLMTRNSSFGVYQVFEGLPSNPAGSMVTIVTRRHRWMVPAAMRRGREDRWRPHRLEQFNIYTATFTARTGWQR